MQTIQELHQTLQDLVVIASHVPATRVILANQGRPAPFGNMLYSTYNLIPIRAYGHSRNVRVKRPPAEDFDEDLDNWFDFEETQYTAMELMLSVNFLNSGADTAVMRLHNANFRADVSAYLHRNNIAWRYVSPCRNLSNILQAGIQPRYQADINLFIEQNVSYALLRAAGFNTEIREETSNVILH